MVHHREEGDENNTLIPQARVLPILSINVIMKLLLKDIHTASDSYCCIEQNSSEMKISCSIDLDKSSLL